MGSVGLAAENGRLPGLQLFTRVDAQLIG